MAEVEFHLNWYPQIFPIEYVVGLRENHLLELPYFAADIPSLTISFRLHRDYLGLKGFEYTQNPANNTIMYSVAFSFFDDRNDSGYGLQRLTKIWRRCFQLYRNCTFSFSCTNFQLRSTKMKTIAHSLTIHPNYIKGRYVYSNAWRMLTKFINNSEETRIDYSGTPE